MQRQREGVARLLAATKRWHAPAVCAAFCSWKELAQVRLSASEQVVVVDNAAGGVMGRLRVTAGAVQGCHADSCRPHRSLSAMLSRYNP